MKPRTLAAVLGLLSAWTLAIGCDGGTEPVNACKATADCALPASPCLVVSCDTGACALTFAAPRTACDLDAGALCDGAGECRGCLDDGDCTAAICDKNGSCVASCDDLSRDGVETDVDCGGAVCSQCVNGKGCAAASDCESGFCDDGGGAPAAICAACLGDEDCGGVPGSYCEGGACRAKKGAGETCRGVNECASGFCPSGDGVCCDAACDGACSACLTDKTGTSDGTCAPVAATTDPDGECAVEDPASCGNSGAGCNGDAATPGCTQHGVAVECLAASCKDGVAATVVLCDGAGSCPASTSTPCAPFVCDAAATACIAACSKDGDCVTGFFCDANGSCKPEGNTGTTCSGNNQCSSKQCADGVCCNKACDGACDACSVAKGGAMDGVCTVLGLGTLGTPACAPYVCNGAGAVCPLACTTDAQCVSSHYCDGTACVVKKAKGTGCTTQSQCATAFCNDGVCCDTACGGSCNACSVALGATMNGTCAVVADGGAGQPSCTPYLCDGNAAICPLACGADGDCTTGNYCGATKCLAKKVNGISCGMAKECQSANCVDGRCCGATCGGACEACNLIGKEGLCSLVGNGADLANECVGHCDGAGSCAGPTYTFDTQPIFKKYCNPCHSGMGGSGGLKISDVYADAFLIANTCPGKTKGACTIVRIKSGSMAPGAGCTGNPALDSANPKCLIAAEQATLEAWIADGMPQ